MEEQVDFLVIGSGFGGSVSALRLAEKGYSVAVLEAGKRWRPTDFAETNWNARKFLWAPGLGCHGIQRIRMFQDFLAIGGAGVGGGSLVYAAVLMAPLDPFYKDPQWAHLDPDWKATLAPHYATARRMLGVARAPRLWKGDELLKEYAADLGRPEEFDSTEVGIFFGDEPGKTYPDPFFDGEGPERTACDFTGACLIGCRSGSKNSLDHNYLYFAEKKGARVVPEALVTAVRPDGAGGYLVESRRATALIPQGKKTWRARNVVLAAGALGTLELLLKCKEKGLLPRLSDQLGRKFRTNSENITTVESRAKGANYSEGVAISSIAKVNDSTSIELVRYKEGADAMGLFATGLRLIHPLKFLLTLITHPIEFSRTINPFGWARRSVIFLVMQVVDNSLDMVRRRSWLRPWRKVLKSDNPKGSIPVYLPEATHCAESIAAKIGGVPSSRWSKVLLNKSITAHVMGGCSMGAGPGEGVVDKHGRVFGHPGLYVADGSVVSANLGVNPSLTIAALAEHVMSAVPAKGEAGAGR